jgi:hypothetical protein
MEIPISRYVFGYFHPDTGNGKFAIDLLFLTMT